MQKRGIKRRFKRKYRRVKKQKIYHPINSPLKYHKYVRSRFVMTLAGNTGTSTFGAISFKLSDLPNSNEFTSLYDEYRIDWVKLMFLPYNQTNNTIAGTTVPWFVTLVDYDDDTAPADINEMLQHADVRISTANKPYTKKIYPRFAQNIYISGVSTGYGARKGFIDCASSTVPHYGLKYGLNVLSAANTFAYQVFAVYHITMRGVR